MSIPSFLGFLIFVDFVCIWANVRMKVSMLSKSDNSPKGSDRVRVILPVKIAMNMFRATSTTRTKKRPMKTGAKALFACFISS